MSKFDFDLDAARSKLLSDLKQQDEPGAMRPQIHKVLNPKQAQDIAAPDIKLQWMYYAGMGDFALHDLRSEVEERAARKLIKEGILVPTSKQNLYGRHDIQRLTHFDDVNWGKTADGKLIIFNLTDFDSCPEWPDEIITPDETHDAAIDYLKRRTGYGKTMEDAPLTLRDGSQITPILTNRRLIEFRKRQQGLIPSQG